MLPVTCLGLALGAVPSCNDDCPVWDEAVVLDLGVTEDLHAIAVDRETEVEGRSPFYVVGAGGLIVTVNDTITIDRPVTADLRGVVAHREHVLAVGDGGTVVRAPLGGGAWEVIDVGVDDDLHAIVPGTGAFFDLVLGDDVLLVHDLSADTWVPAPPPVGGWGSLRAGFRQTTDGTHIVVGLQGTAWRTRDVLGAWEPLDLDTIADLHVALGGDAVIVGSDGTLRRYIGDEWRAWDADPDRDFIAASSAAVMLTDAGELLGLKQVTSGELRHIADLSPDMTDVAFANDGVEDNTGMAIVVGAAGHAVTLGYTGCQPRY